MRVPERFGLFGQTWRVERDKFLSDREGLLGKCDTDECLIVLQEGLSESVSEQVYLHELVHAVLDSMHDDLSKNEQFVDIFSALLHQAFTSAVGGTGEDEDDGS